MKEKIKEFFKSNGRLAILILFILELIISLCITPSKFDDAFFIEKSTNSSIISFVLERYNTWTSRVIIEFVLCSVLRISKYLWILIEACMVTIVRIFNFKNFYKR